MPRSMLAVLPLQVFVLVGCGGGSEFDLVPVSGKVTLNDQPLANATVNFIPESSTEDGLAPSSFGRTNEAGEFTLRTLVDDRAGAMVGKHKVRITLAEDEESDSDIVDTSKKKSIPARYNVETELTFDVVPGGTDGANFDLEP